MSGSNQEFQRRVGNRLYLRLGLNAGDTDKRVFATIKDENLNILQTNIELNLIGPNATYGESMAAMPNNPFITAHFEVFESDGITPANYSPVFDSFDRISENSGSGNSTSGTLGAGIGRIKTKKFKGYIKQVKLKGYIKE